ncbi:MAG: carbohydrate-binding family 9-like protein [bacterium]
MESYLIKKKYEEFIVDGNWNKSEWEKIEPINLNNYMGSLPEHFPATLFKLCYTDKALYLISMVKDKYVLALAENNFEPVFKDSCVEFFFTAKNKTNSGYFNLETNCGGTLLFGYRENILQKSIKVSNRDIAKISLSTTLPKIIKTEIIEDTTWVIEYRLPFEILNEYCKVDVPQKNTVWFANFYKCADNSSKPHWLTWNKIEFPEPNFHLPKFFGKIVFE